MGADVVIGILSLLISPIVGFGGVWLGARLTENSLREQREEERKERERQQEEEHEGTRRLVASEVISNFNSLYMLAGLLKRTDGQLSAMVNTFDRSFTLRPDWRRVQWDKASVDAFSADELYRINDWYDQLEAINVLSKDVAAQSALVRDLQQMHPRDSMALKQVLLGQLKRLAQFAQGVFDQGRPFEHPRIDEAHKKERIRREALTRVETDPQGDAVELCSTGS